jgi:alpha-glucosidase (family GH31 glycosyl hydrolase)
MQHRKTQSRHRARIALVTAATLAVLPVMAAVAAPAAAAESGAVVVTTQSPGYSEVGTWATARDASYEGIQPRYSRTAGDTASWSIAVEQAGHYSVAVYYQGSADNGKHVGYDWTGRSGGPLDFDQSQGGGAWTTLGTVDLDAGEDFSFTITASSGQAVTNTALGAITRADALRLAPAGAACGTVSTASEPVSASNKDLTGYSLKQEGTTARIQTEAWTMQVERNGFRYSFERGGKEVAAASPAAGLLLGDDSSELCDAVSSSVESADANGVDFSVLFSDGRTAKVHVDVAAAEAGLTVTPDDGKSSVIRAQLAGGMNPAYGLGDLGGARDNLNVYGVKNLDYYAQNSSGTTSQRFVSDFTVFPDRGFAQVAFDDGHLAIQVDDTATLLGVTGTSLSGLHYFFGDLPTIYRTYAGARHTAGYTDSKPDYDFFGVGYESYGALGYNTNQTTIENSVKSYLEHGYPISWAVTGSGFWPYIGDAQGTTSSFGMWGEKYPDPDGYKSFFADRGIDLILGLRQSFPALKSDGGTYDPAKDGPYVQEALDNGYFITNADGKPRTFSTISFPAGKVYLIDPENKDAVAWFVENERKWGVQGFKEDHMFDATANGFADNDLVNAVDEALADDGDLMMVRNSAFSVPGSILRLNDTDYNQGAKDRDRTVVNGLAYAASGEANFYPDIVGGRMMSDLETNTDKQIYLTRNAMMAAVSPSMSFGNEPWRMSDPTLRDATVKAAQWHAEYQPYIYSAAVDSWKTGFPSTATPLPIAFPDDAATYNLASYSAKQYEWMVGPSLLVAPLYGSDTGTSMSRDVYLPSGTWMDIETGKTFTGPMTLKDYAQPYGKIPAFVGGTGILVHSAGDSASAVSPKAVTGDTLEAQVFPVATQGSTYSYTAKDGSTISKVKADNTTWSADAIMVRDEKGDDVPFTVDATTGAVQFPVVAGTDYVVQDRSADRGNGGEPGDGTGTGTQPGTGQQDGNHGSDDPESASQRNGLAATGSAVDGWVLAGSALVLAGVVLGALAVRARRRSLR